MFISQIAHEIFPDWNKKQITFNYLFDYCKKGKVYIVDAETKEEPLGSYNLRKGYEFIVINKYLPYYYKLWILSHEVYHWRTHWPDTSNFSIGMDDKNEAEANIFAAVATFPRPLIEGLTIEQICKFYKTPTECGQIRMMIANNLNY